MLLHDPASLPRIMLSTRALKSAVNQDIQTCGALADFGEAAGAVAELVGFHVHFLNHREEQIAE